MINEYTASWGASAVINTTNRLSIPKPAYHTKDKIYLVSAYNPSTISDLTATIANIRTIGGIDREQVLYSFSLPKAVTAVIEDCEDAWNEDTVANVTASADASDKKVGSNSAKFAIGANFTTGIIGYEQLSSTNLSLYNTIRLWIKSDKTTVAGQIQILLDNTAKCATPLETLDVPALTADTWTLCYLPLANPSSDLAIVSIGAKITVDGGAQNIWIDDVNALNITGKDIPIARMFMDNTSAQIILSNDTALGANDAFSTTVQISEA